MRFYLLSILGVLLVGGSLLLLLQSRTASELAPSDSLMEKAGRGDVDAIKAMRLRTEKYDQGPLPNYWLYKGALAGDPGLLEEFEEKFRALPDDFKKDQIQSIRTSAAPVEAKNVLLARLSRIYPDGFKNEAAARPKER